jgi:hypothetical protein
MNRIRQSVAGRTNQDYALGASGSDPSAGQQDPSAGGLDPGLSDIGGAPPGSPAPSEPAPDSRSGLAQWTALGGQAPVLPGMMSNMAGTAFISSDPTSAQQALVHERDPMVDAAGGVAPGQPVFRSPNQLAGIFAEPAPNAPPAFTQSGVMPWNTPYWPVSANGQIPVALPLPASPNFWQT